LVDGDLAGRNELLKIGDDLLVVKVMKGRGHRYCLFLSKNQRAAQA
jgi:hypothetical protein